MNSSAPRHARQWIAREPGGLEVFELREVEVPAPGPGEVTVEVRAAGVNPADPKHVARGSFTQPRPVGYEVSGVVAALGPDTELASGGGAVGDEVVAYRVLGGYADALTVRADDVHAKPSRLSHPEAANLLLAAATAAEMLHVVGVGPGDTVVLHGASGAVGLSVLQQARALGVAVVGTASPARHDVVGGYGGTATAYGPGLADRLRALAPPQGYAAALDAIGTDEALEVSLDLVTDRSHVVTIAAQDREAELGIRALRGTDPASAAYRDAARPTLLAMARRGELEVPVARTWPLAEALDALTFLADGHPGGKVALIP